MPVQQFQDKVVLTHPKVCLERSSVYKLLIQGFTGLVRGDPLVRRDRHLLEVPLCD